jgi:hypothetical protein
MCDRSSVPLVTTFCARADRLGLALLVGLLLAVAAANQAAAETATELVLRPAKTAGYDPFESGLPQPKTRKPTRKAFDEPRLIAPVDDRS